MKAMVMEAPGLENLRLKEVADPEAGPGEVLVRLRAASLNFRDVLALRGGYGSRQKQAGLIPLSDGAGEVVQVGRGVRNFKPGDRVVNSFFPRWLAGPPDERFLQQDLGGIEDGVACELRVFAADGLVAIPAGMSYLEAATLPCAAVTAWNAVRVHGNAGPEQTVLTQGSGGVALFALQFARAAGARVIVISSTASKLERLQAVGAQHGINYSDDAEWGKTARKITAGRGVDLVVETAGAATLKQSIRATRVGGMIAMIGMVSGPTAELNLPLVAMGSLRVHGIAVGSREHLEQVLAACAVNGLKPVIDRAYPLADLAEALRHVESGRQFGKVCVEIG
ncbi:NAD(P)-dependent alcohol dehydrogenase [Ramlibacter tataouinensis]|uniref:zinc-dependent alcohol dehydrogenase family protein n=1 Tax=Ramlibacter tataouinensis TaxID=94132 RepID=UPI0022F3A6C9|nr:NAD(P)-dependent alcohol dehydrogenase [Ramlibacter tataouinensis]WBY02939.1 NAD(P)-dependent alcohol dehydrogenase [Ramlibacter tataouinensis]